jgi:hypothetical protein
MISVKDIEFIAKRELEDEEFREAVNKRKEELRARKNLPWYKKLFPFKIKIERI